MERVQFELFVDIRVHLCALPNEADGAFLVCSFTTLQALKTPMHALTFFFVVIGQEPLKLLEQISVRAQCVSDSADERVRVNLRLRPVQLLTEAALSVEVLSDVALRERRAAGARRSILIRSVRVGSGLRLHLLSLVDTLLFHLLLELNQRSLGVINFHADFARLV